MPENKGRLWRLLLSVDQFLAVLLLDASEDETMSSYIGRNYHGGWLEKAIDGLFLALTGERDHCINNIEQQFVGSADQRQWLNEPAGKGAY